MFNESPERRLLVITDDEFFAEVIGTYMKRDRIVIERVSSAETAGGEIAALRAGKSSRHPMVRKSLSSSLQTPRKHRARIPPAAA
jgi:hypothetical protein